MARQRSFPFSSFMIRPSPTGHTDSGSIGVAIPRSNKYKIPSREQLGLPRIVGKEAAIVRQIYKLFLTGKTPSGIAKYLTEDSIPTPSGKNNWQPSTVLSMLQNEKYKGDAVLKKTFTVEFLTKKIKVNEGEIPQYYVENSQLSTQSLIQLKNIKSRVIPGFSAFKGRL